MELFLLRHGDAGPYTSPDELRPLSTLGRNQLKSSLEPMQAVLASVDVIVASPYLRAQQSADVAQIYLPNAVRTTCELSTPDSHPAKFIEWLYRFHQQNPFNGALVVAHNPFLTYLLRDFLGADDSPVFQTGSLMHLKMEVIAAQMGELQRSVHPKSRLQ